MLTAIKSLFSGREKPVVKLARSLVEKNDFETLRQKFEPQQLLELRFVTETFNQINEGFESTVLIIEQRTLIALAMDHMAANIIHGVGQFCSGDPVVCYRETQSLKGTVALKKLRQTGFKSITRLEIGLREYFLRWNLPRQRLLMSRDNADLKNRAAYEATLAALRHRFGLDINEFTSREKR